LRDEALGSEMRLFKQHNKTTRHYSCEMRHLHISIEVVMKKILMILILVSSVDSVAGTRGC
jgi:hypothetical protein